MDDVELVLVRKGVQPRQELADDGLAVRPAPAVRLLQKERLELPRAQRFRSAPGGHRHDRAVPDRAPVVEGERVQAAPRRAARVQMLEDVGSLELRVGAPVHVGDPAQAFGLQWASERDDLDHQGPTIRARARATIVQPSQRRDPRAALDDGVERPLVEGEPLMLDELVRMEDERQRSPARLGSGDELADDFAGSFETDLGPESEQ